MESLKSSEEEIYECKEAGGAWKVVQFEEDTTLSRVAHDELSPISQIAIDALQKRGLGVLKSQKRK